MISFQQEINAEIELDEKEVSEIIWCSSVKIQAKVLNHYAECHLKVGGPEIQEISENLNPKTKEFLMKLCQEKK